MLIVGVDEWQELSSKDEEVRSPRHLSMTERCIVETFEKEL